MAEQMRDRGFAVGSCDPDPGDLLKGIPGQIHLAAHLDAFGSQLEKSWVIPTVSGGWVTPDLTARRRTLPTPEIPIDVGMEFSKRARTVMEMTWGR